MKKVKRTITYKGKIWGGEYGDNYDTVFIGYNSTPVAKRIQEELGWGKNQVSIRFWISDNEQTKEELTTNQLQTLVGDLEARYSDRYSELTGYLWTDESLLIGGHDLLNILTSHKDKFIYLEIDIH